VILFLSPAFPLAPCVPLRTLGFAALSLLLLRGLRRHPRVPCSATNTHSHHPQQHTDHAFQ
jgi:hypothetical protein